MNKKIIVDILMMIVLFALNGYQFLSESMHEYLGMLMFILFIVHHLLNKKWHQTLTKGRYSLTRSLYLVVDVLILVTMLTQMYSGIVMSRHLFSTLDIPGSMALVRKLHILGAYWGFILIGIHLGMHWNMLRKKMKLDRLGIYGKVLTAVIVVYGVIAFIKRDFLTYMFLRTEFVFMDFSESVLLYYLDIFAIMGLCVFIGYLLMKGARYRHVKK